MTASNYTKDDKYICNICGKTVQKYNKTRHNRRKFHKLIEYCKKTINDLIIKSQINSK